MRTLNLALQGGGSHGAFTWGVLDALLADPRITIEGLSGTSAGAVNAVALASGYAKGLADGTDPRRGARDSMARIWDQIAAWGTVGSLQRRLGTILWGGLPAELAPTYIWANAMRGRLSPYQSNPLDINPLRSLLEREIDFKAIDRAPQLKVFVSATHVRTGRAVIFTGTRLDAQAVTASACLPMLFHAVTFPALAGACLQQDVALGRFVASSSEDVRIAPHCQPGASAGEMPAAQERHRRAHRGERRRMVGLQD